jgi:pimeloyl-ACP methyl ester carboxylesterase
MVALATHRWAPPDSADGAGAPTVLLVHGVAGWHRTWWRVGPALARHGWRVLAVDLRGHGHSPRIEGTITVADLADDVAEEIEGSGAPIDALIGHSLGAAVSAELAFRHPELVQRLVLEDPPAISRVGDVAWLGRLERELAAAHADFDGEVAREVAANPGWKPEDARQDVEGKQLADRPGIVASFAGDVGTRVLELAPRLRVPALYLLGAEDRSVFPASARAELATGLPPGSRVEVFDAGHTIHRDAFAAYLDAVLAWIGEAKGMVR